MDIPIQKLAALLTDGAWSMVRRNSGVSSLVTNDMNTKNRYLIIRHCFIHQHNLCEVPQHKECF
jgi:hypothetical protein